MKASTRAFPEERLWTRLEYERAARLGLFGPEERLELIEGRIFRKVTVNSPHSTGTQLVQDALIRIFARGHVVRVQQPLALTDCSEPEPDVAVVGGVARDYLEAHPQTAVLVVEIADTSLAVDRTTKAGLYARARIPEYWILNLVERVLEVHRDPHGDAEQPLGHHYRSVCRLTSGETVSPLAVPETSMAVADLLP